MKKKGFTLIELLAVIVILGVIMIIAIPSVTSYITNSRKDSYIADAKMFVNAAKTMLTADATLPQEAGSKVIVPISDIALDKGGEKSPYGNDWDYDNSYVVVENQGTSSDPNYVWQVALNDTKGNCIPLTAMNDLRREDVGTNCSIENPLGSTLIAKITSGAKVDTSINFNDVPTEATSGVYILSGTENDTNPIYYYRGIVSNNNVKFAGFCWKMVRTTETGGVKLIYNGEPRVQNEIIAFERNQYTNLTNDATYPFSYNDVTKEWTSTNNVDSSTGTITFSASTSGEYVLNYSVSTENNYDKAYFYLDGVELGVYSGEKTGTIELGNITSSNIITVKYTKDSSGSTGKDSVSFKIGVKTDNSIVDCNNTGEASQLADAVSFNNNYYYQNAYLGYMHGEIDADTYEETHANIYDSKAKATIDTWYQENMVDYTASLEDTVWCNDRSTTTYDGISGNGAGKTPTIYSGYNRVGYGGKDNPQPSLSCTNANDRFTVSTANGNGALTYPVGLLTVDEAALAGSGTYGYNALSYLNTGQMWWLMTPSFIRGSDPAMFMMWTSGNANYGGYIEYYGGLRPTISLKAGTIVTGGDGSVSTPYVVE